MMQKAQSVSPAAGHARTAGRWGLLFIVLLIFLPAHPNIVNDSTASTVNIEKAGHIKARARLMKIQQLNERGKYAEAIQFALQLLTLFEQKSGAASKEEALCLDILGGLYVSIGDFENAVAILNRALKVHVALEGPQSPEAAGSLALLAKVMVEVGDYASALPYAEDALRIRENVFGQDHFMVSTSLNTLGEIHVYRQRFDTAEQYFMRALKIREKHLNSHGLIITLNHLGRLYNRIGHYEMAETVTETALAMGAKILPGDHPHLAETLNLLGMIHAATGRYETGFSLLKRAQYSQLKSIANIKGYTSEYQKLKYLERIETDLYVFLSLIAGHLSHSPEAVKESLNIVLRRKGIVLEVQKQFQEAMFKGNKKSLQAFRELSEIRTVISNLVLDGPQEAAWQDYTAKLAHLNSKKEQLEIRLSRLSRSYARSATTAAADCDRIASVLPPGTALIELSQVRRYSPEAPASGKWGAFCYLAFILEAQRPDAVHLIELGDAARIDKAVLNFKAAKPPVYRRDKNRINALAGELYARVFLPLEKKLGSVRYIFIAPDGNLNLIPFEIFQHPDGRFLIEKFTFNYLSSGRDLMGFGVSQSGPQASVLIGDPDFNLSEQERSEILEGHAIRGTSSNWKHVSEELKNHYFKALPGTRIEVNLAASILGVDSVVAYTGKTALEEVLMQVESPRFLHLATHGFFLEDQTPGIARAGYPAGDYGFDRSRISTGFVRQENPLVRSGFALAGANRFFDQNGAKSGIVTAEKILGLNLLGTEMVVLSACETGLGEVKTGEGVMGLRRAFSQAGARSVVMSMWTVVDKLAPELIAQFYLNIVSGNMNRAEALRRATLGLLQTSRYTNTYTDPYFWGAFVFLGEP